MNQKIILTIIFLLSIQLLALFIGQTTVSAQSCSGTVECGTSISRVCRDTVTGNNCIEGTPNCSCSNQCVGGGSHSCNAYPICQASSICGVYEGVCVRSGSCNYTPPSPVCGNGLCQSGETCSSCPSDCGACSGGGSGGSGSGGTGGGTTCSGACFAGISNCGAVGRPNGSGTCGAGELCCDPPVAPPPSRSCQFYRWDTTYQGRPAGQPGFPIGMQANNTYRTVGVGMGGSGGLPDDGVCFRSVDPDTSDGFDARFQLSNSSDSDRGDGTFGGNYYETRIRSAVPMHSQLWVYDNDDGTCSDGPEECEIRLDVFFNNNTNPPTMTITDPTDGQIVQSGSTLPIISEIVDDGSIYRSRMTRLRVGEPQRSRLFVGGNLIAVPFTWYWTNVPLGADWRLRGYAVDNDYNLSWSNQVQIGVSTTAPPTCTPPAAPTQISPIDDVLVGATGTTDRTVRLDMRTQSDPIVDAEFINLEIYPTENSAGCTDDDCSCDDGWCGVVSSATGVAPNTQVFQNFVIPASVYGDFPQYQWRVQHSSSAACSNLDGEWSEWEYFRLGENMTGTVYQDNGGPYGPICQTVGALNPYTGGASVTISSSGHPDTVATVNSSNGTFSALVPVSSNISAALSLPGGSGPTAPPTSAPTPTPTSTPSVVLPTVDLRVNGGNGPITISSGTSINISWTTTDSDECRASGAWVDTGWSGPKPISGSHTYTATQSLTYTIRCNETGGLHSAEDSVQINVAGSPPAPPVPDVTLTFNGASGVATVAPGTTGTLSWSSNQAGACNAGRDWSGVKSPTGSESTGPINSDRVFSLSCTGAGGNASTHVEVVVSTGGSTPTPTPTPTPPPSSPPSSVLQCVCPNSSCQHSGITSPFPPITYFVQDTTIRGAWWQVENGPISADNIISSQIPVIPCSSDPNCEPYVIRDSAGVGSGIMVTGNDTATAIDTSDESGYQTTQIAPSSPIMIRGSHTEGVIENYDYFYRNFSMGVSPTSDINENNATKPGSGPTNGRAYFADGDTEIRNPTWDVAANESYVVFVDGNLHIEDEIQVAEGGFLAFIVKGDISIDETVCQSDHLSEDPIVEGLFLADGTLTVESGGSGDCKFVGGGSFVGWSGVNLQRDFADGGAQDTWNAQSPTEFFTYRPDLIVNMPERMTTPLYLWQEVAP